VEYIECYRRLIPSSDPASLYQCWDEGSKLIILVTSNEGLRNLTKMVGSEHQQSLLTSTLVVVSTRAVNLAGELGFEKKPELAATVSNEAIYGAIKHRHSLNKASLN
jgi:uroporphyrinogen-III synthase